jgi:hypothetical protein
MPVLGQPLYALFMPLPAFAQQLGPDRSEQERRQQCRTKHYQSHNGNVYKIAV